MSAKTGSTIPVRAPSASGPRLRSIAPAQLSHRPGGLAGRERLLAGGGAVGMALHDALQDGRHAEHVVGEIKTEILLAHCPAGALAIGGDVLFFAGNAERLKIQPGDAAELAWRDMPAHAVISEIDQRVSER